MRFRHSVLLSPLAIASIWMLSIGCDFNRTLPLTDVGFDKLLMDSDLVIIGRPIAVEEISANAVSQSIDVETILKGKCDKSIRIRLSRNPVLSDTGFQIVQFRNTTTKLIYRDGGRKINLPAIPTVLIFLKKNHDQFELVTADSNPSDSVRELVSLFPGSEPK